MRACKYDTRLGLVVGVDQQGTDIKQVGEKGRKEQVRGQGETQDTERGPGLICRHSKLEVVATKERSAWTGWFHWNVSSLLRNSSKRVN